jgi:geranylgeranyl pyrophosphate synthase
MRFEGYVAQARPRLEAAFGRCLAGLFGDMALPGSAGLAALLAEGKKIRGCLLCLVSDALGGAADSPIARAVAVELVHAATLIHDDFVDQDTMRRNRPAVWTLRGARRAVLLGDVIFATAIRMMTDLGRDDGGVIADAIARVSMGAFREPLDGPEMAALMQSGGGSGSLYEKIIQLKTGVLFAAACELGAIAAGAGAEVRARMRSYGMRVGEAYQIADDAGDVARHLSAGSLQPAQMAALAPAILFFAGESRAEVARALAAGRCADGEWLDCLSLVGTRMDEEIERRIDSAIEEIRWLHLRSYLGEMICAAPRDLILMFRRAH